MDEVHQLYYMIKSKQLNYVFMQRHNAELYFQSLLKCKVYLYPMTKNYISLNMAM